MRAGGPGRPWAPRRGGDSRGRLSEAIAESADGPSARADRRRSRNICRIEGAQARAEELASTTRPDHGLWPPKRSSVEIVLATRRAVIDRAKAADPERQVRRAISVLSLVTGPDSTTTGRLRNISPLLAQTSSSAETTYGRWAEVKPTWLDNWRAGDRLAPQLDSVIGRSPQALTTSRRRAASPSRSHQQTRSTGRLIAGGQAGASRRCWTTNWADRMPGIESG